MKGEDMLNTDQKETTSTPRRRVIWIGFGAIAIVAIAVGLWFGARPSSRPKPRQHTPMSSMADMASSSDDTSTDATAANAELRVELGPDDLKKAQVQTVYLDVRETSGTLRVPGIVNPDEYREVHVTPLVGGVIRQVPLVLPDHLRRAHPMPSLFTSDLPHPAPGSP